MRVSSLIPGPRAAALPVALLLAALWWGTGPAWADAGSSPVAVFPSPGTSYNLPGTQVTFRGIPAADIGDVEVVGSVSGVHTGQIEADSDGNGGSFLPDKPFVPGETVTVTTNLDVLGGSGGTFSFTIVHPSAQIAPAALPVVAAGANGLQHFRSRPDLAPAAVTVTQDTAPASEGDIFVAPQSGPAQDGPMILDSQGNLVWFLPFPVSSETLITDFRAQNLGGQPVLTWWQGNTNEGSGRGHGVILDQHYQQIASVYAGNGLQMDLHEFLVTPQGDAYIIAVSPVSLPGINKPVMDSVVQEIDIKTGLVLFEWHALDHVPLGQSNFAPSSPGFIFDPYHVNSIALASDGNLIVSMRNTSAVYKIDHQTGNVIWQLGGNASSFTMGQGTTTWGQHDAVVQPDGTLTLFDDGAGPPRAHPYSRGIREQIDTASMTATLVREYDHSPDLSANYEGSTQTLPDGNVFLGWGQQPYFSEDTATGAQDFDAHFVVPTTTYRAYRFTWNGQPLTPPDIAVSAGSGTNTNVYASWNGATGVTAWRVLAGPGPASLQSIAVVPDQGFETTISVPGAYRYYAVQALGPSGGSLGTSATVTPSQAGTTAGAPNATSTDGHPGSAARRQGRCPAATGRLAGGTLGRLKLGMSRRQTDRAYAGRSSRGKRYEEFFCLSPEGIRVGFASPRLLSALPPSERSRVRGRAVLILTANPHYHALAGITHGDRIAGARARLRLGRALHLGVNYWYLVPTGSSTTVVKVRRGVVQEIGVADGQLTNGAAAQLTFMRSFY